MRGARAHPYARAAGAKNAAHARNSTSERLLIFPVKHTQGVAHKWPWRRCSIAKTV